MNGKRTTIARCVMLPALAGFIFAAPDGSTQAPKTPAKSSKKKAAKQAAVKLPASKKSAKVAAAPAKPPADIPLVKSMASVWRGCLESNEPRQLESLASKLVMDETRLGSLLEEQGLLQHPNDECVPYVAATGGEGGVASAVFERTEAKANESAILAVRKTAEGVTVTPGACDCPEPALRVLTLTAKEALDAQNDLLETVPSSVRWQLNVLLPRMIGARNATGSDGADPYSVRIEVQRHTGEDPEHLHSVEILETATGNRVDGVWWLERSGSPGVLVGMEGAAYERLLWQSPVKYTQTSRGVGLSVTTARRVIAPPKGSKAKPTVKYVKVREYHIGVDMLAAKGMDVHAVGDASVAFAGRMGGYGNLVILDHGLGYETYYAHLSAIKKNIKAGTTVSRGEVLGLVGSTGHSTAPHLHFETRKDAKYIDPFDETRQLEFWLLSADDQERLAMELLASEPAPDHNDKVANSGGAALSGE